MTPSLHGLEDARAVLIAGPTASGKSVLALQLAEQAISLGRDPMIVNADSMQVYDALRILTARPGPAETAGVLHRMYGYVPAETRHSVGAWLRDVEPIIAEWSGPFRLPVVVGGTGLYFKAVLEGLAATPAILPDVRAEWTARLASDGAAALHSVLSVRDPSVARTIRPSDPQRILRALEVLDSTGASLAEWRTHRQTPPLLDRGDVIRLVVEPSRDELHRRIEARLDRMVCAGAVDETAALLRRGLDPNLPVMKAIGVREFAAFFRNVTTLEEAVARAKTETRRYAKRQGTWFRNQMPDWQRVRGTP